jgi:hypothetical protein
MLLLKPSTSGGESDIVNRLKTRMERRSLFAPAVVFVACLLTPTAPAWAHHSFGAEYDGTKPITLTGVVTEVQWTNPHFYFFIDVKNPNGAMARWKFEGYPPTVLNRIGWKKNATMLPGDTITVFGWRARDGSNWGHSRTVTFAKNGQQLQSGPPAGNGDGGNKPPVAAK